MKQDHFTFFRSFRDQIDLLEDKDQLKLYRAITGYALFGEVPEFEETILKLAWIGIEPILNKGYDISIIRAEAGKKGGENGKGVSRNVGNQNALKSNEPFLDNSELMSSPKTSLSITRKKEIPFKDLPIEERKENFIKEVSAYESEYGVDMIRAFCDYWTERKKDKILMRFELEKVFEISCRLRRWATANYKTIV